MADASGPGPTATLVPEDEHASAAPAGGETAGSSYASGARILTIGIASTGIFTFAYLATASHVLSSKAK